MCSKVWFDKDRTWAYKEMPKTMCDNAVYCLRKLFKYGYVPEVERVDTEIIRTRFIEVEKVTDSKKFMWHLPLVLHALEEEGIRHGNLSHYSVIPNGNKPYLINFSESRVSCDPRVDKLPEGDEYWLTRTMEFYAEGNL